MRDLLNGRFPSFYQLTGGIGHRGAALAEYEKLRADLRRALGVDPLPETEEAVKHALGRSSRRPTETPQTQATQ